MTVLLSKDEKISKDFVILNDAGELEKFFLPRLETPRNLELEKELPYNVAFFDGYKSKAEIRKEKINLEDAEEIDWKSVYQQMEDLGLQELFKNDIKESEKVQILEKEGLLIAVNLKK